MFKRLLTVSGFTALSRLTGFLSSMVMAYVMGAGPASDAFMAAFRFPNTFRSVFGEGAFNNAFLPRYAAINTTQGQAEAQRFADEIYSWQIVAQLFLLAVALLAMRWIIAIIAPGFSAQPGQAELAAELTRITFPYLIMTVSSVQLSAMLNARGKFAAAAAWSILLNLTMMVCLFLASWFPSAAHAAACGVFIGGVVQLAFIAAAAARQSLHLRIRLPRWTPRVKEFMAALGSATIGSASVQISVFIDTVLASFLPGALTALYYADRINQLPTGTLAIALGTVLLPEMSNLLAKGDRAGADAAQNRSAALGLLLTLPFVAVFFLIPDVIMRALFAHGHFDVAAAHLSAMALAAYGIGLPAFVLIRSVSATFYARGDTNSPMRATLIAFTVNVMLKFLFVWGMGMGVAGIALGTAAGAWINLIGLVVMAQRQHLISIGPVFRRSLVPSVLAAIVAGGGAWAGAQLGLTFVSVRMWQDVAALSGAVLLSITLYMLVVFLFRHQLPVPGRRRR